MIVAITVYTVECDNCHERHADALSSMPQDSRTAILNANRERWFVIRHERPHLCPRCKEWGA